MKAADKLEKWLLQRDNDTFTPEDMEFCGNIVRELRKSPEQSNFLALLVLVFGWIGAGIALFFGYGVKVTCKRKEW